MVLGWLKRWTAPDNAKKKEQTEAQVKRRRVNPQKAAMNNAIRDLNQQLNSYDAGYMVPEDDEALAAKQDRMDA